MTLLKLGDLSIVLEKVCAYELMRPRNNTRSEDTEPYLRVMLDGGAEINIYGAAMISSFTRAVKDFAKK